MRSTILVVLGFLSVVILASCGGSNSTSTPPPTLSSMTLSATSVSPALGTTTQITATGTYSDGSRGNVTGITWTSSNPAVATVDSNGLVTTKSQGTATITVTVGAVSTTITVTVGPPTLNSVALAATSQTPALGNPVQITATGTYSDGSTHTVTGVTWTSSNAAVATVDSNGVVTTKSQGTATITASVGAVSTTITVTVGPPTLSSLALVATSQTPALGNPVQITATGTYSDGSIQTVTGVTWTSSNTVVATVNSNGVVTTRSQGTATITASVGGVSKTITITVGPAVIASITINPANPSIAVNAQKQLAAIATYTDTTTTDITATATWSSGSTAIAVLDGTIAGKFHGIAVGQSQISATQGGITGSTTLTVTTASVNGVAFLYATAWDSASHNYVLKTYAVPVDGTMQEIGSRNAASRKMVSDGMRFLYFDTGGTIEGYRINPDSGALTALPTFTPAQGALERLIVDPTGKWIYGFDTTSLSGDAKIRVLGIDQNTGALSDTGFAYPLPNGASVPRPKPVSSFVTNENGTFFYFGGDGGSCSGYGGSGPCKNLHGYRVDLNTGALTPISGTPFDSWSPQTFAMGISSDGATLWLSLDAFRIVRYSLHPLTGVPSQVQQWWGQTSQSGTPIHSIVPRSNYFYAGPAGQSDKLLRITPDPVTGALGGSVFPWTLPNQGSVADIAVNRPYSKLFVAESGGSDGGGLSSFTLDNAGLPTLVVRTPLNQPEQLIVIGRPTAQPPVLAALTISPSNPSVTAGTGQSFTATGTMTDGSPAGSLTITWASSNPSVATIDSSGAASTLSAGTTTITATCGSISASTRLTVTAAVAHTVSYDGNGNSGGTVPTDANTYTPGQTVTVLGNTGSLVKAGYSFAGWNTQANGGGTNYTPGSSFSMGSANVTLYAKWVASQPAGTRDTTFGTNGIVSSDLGGIYPRAEAMTLQADGKIILAGWWGGSSGGFFVARLNPDGSFDTSFGAGGTGYVTTKIGGGGMARAVAIQPADGKIVAAGDTEGTLTVARYNTDGTLDTTFGSGSGYVVTNVGTYPGTSSPASWGNGLAIQSNGQIVVTGHYYDGGAGYDSHIYLARYNGDGSLDNSFGSNGIVTTTAGGTHEESHAIAIENNSQIVIAGRSDWRFLVARYNLSDGSLDSSFGNNGIVITSITNHSSAQALAIQPDGMIVVAGYADYGLGGAWQFVVARYSNIDGSLDTMFGGGAGYVTTDIGGDSSALAVALQNDGKIVVGGQGPGTFSWAYTLARYNADGSLDTGFGSQGKVSTNVEDGVRALAIQPDGKILAFGSGSSGPINVVRYWP